VTAFCFVPLRLIFCVHRYFGELLLKVWTSLLWVLHREQYTFCIFWKGTFQNKSRQKLSLISELCFFFRFSRCQIPRSAGDEEIMQIFRGCSPIVLGGADVCSKSKSNPCTQPPLVPNSTPRVRWVCVWLFAPIYLRYMSIYSIFEFMESVGDNRSCIRCFR
jgi:hypothetical protein